MYIIALTEIKIAAIVIRMTIIFCIYIYQGCCYTYKVNNIIELVKVKKKKLTDKLYILEIWNGSI